MVSRSGRLAFSSLPCRPTSCGQVVRVAEQDGVPHARGSIVADRHLLAGEQAGLLLRLIGTTCRSPYQVTLGHCDLRTPGNRDGTPFCAVRSRSSRLLGFGSSNWLQAQQLAHDHEGERQRLKPVNELHASATIGCFSMKERRNCPAKAGRCTGRIRPERGVVGFNSGM